MRGMLGMLIVMIGVLLMFWGLGAYDSFASQVSRLFTGTPTDKSQWLLIGGALTLLVGMAIGFSRGHHHHKTQ